MGYRAAALISSFAFASLTVNCSNSPGSPAESAGAGTSGSVSGLTAAGSGGSPATTAGGSGSSVPAIGGTGPGPATGGSATGGIAPGGAGASGAPSTGGSGGSDVATSGSASGGASGGVGPAVACPGDAVFCDDFESYAAMSPPSGKWKTWTVGNGTLVVDTAHGFSGTKAAHFHGKVSQSGGTKEQAFMLAQGAPAFPVAGNTFYLRFMVYGTRFPYTGVTTANHTALAWIGSSKGLNSPDQGEAGKGYILADYNGVSVEPMWMGYFRDTSKHFKDTDQANTWHCWEVEIDNAGGPPPGATGAALPHIWEDSTELKLVEGGGSAPYPAVPFEALLFSLWSPQTDTSAADYWVDDVAVSKSRVNCPPPK